MTVTDRDIDQLLADLDHETGDLARRSAATIRALIGAEPASDPPPRPAPPGPYDVCARCGAWHYTHATRRRWCPVFVPGGKNMSMRAWGK